MIGRLYSLILSLGSLTLITFSLWSVWSKIVNVDESHAGHVEYRILTIENVTSKPFELHSLSDTDLHSLIDLPSFNFNINQKVCNNNTKLIVALVHTAPGHHAKRQAIRDTWAKMIPTLFFMGLPDSNITQNNVVLENQLYSDIIQGDFIDCYRNLTYKHVMVLKWTLYYCPCARYLLKTDDDTLVNAPYLLEILNHRLSPLGARNLLMCQLMFSSMVKRSYRSKWRVSYSEYPNRWYPIYCRGWAIVYSPDVIYKLYTEAQVTPYFWIDDVHITGTIAVKQNITQTDLGELAVDESDILDDRNISRKFLFCLLKKADKSMRKFWNIILQPDDAVVSSSTNLGLDVNVAEDSAPTDPGVCGKFMTACAWVLVVITFPFSLFVCFKVVQEYERAVIFRLGRLVSGGAKGPGIFFILPCIDNYARVDLRTRTYDVPPQEVLTKDSVTVSVDAVVYYRVCNATISVANVANAHQSTRLLAQTTLRNVLGTRPLHEILSDRDAISKTMQVSLDEATESWGIKVERVEIKDVRLPVQLQRAMAAEAEAAREARAKVIAAEGEQKASRALREASEVISDSPAALQLRYLQTLNTISAEKNSTIVFPLPIDIISFFTRPREPRELSKLAQQNHSS